MLPTRCPPVIIGGVPLAATEKTAGRHLHLPVSVGTRHVADAMIAGPHRHLPLARRDDDRCDDGRRGYGRNHRESSSTGRYGQRSDSGSRTPPRECYERERERFLPRRESAPDRDRSRDYDRRLGRDDSRTETEIAGIDEDVYSFGVYFRCPHRILLCYVSMTILLKILPHLRTFLHCVM